MRLFSRSGQSGTAAGPSTLQQSTTQADGPASIAANSNPEPTPIERGGNYGIKVLHDGGSEACVDIVFVHGLTGNAYDTWLHKATRVHWPRDLLKQDLEDIRVLSFGYDADIVNMWNPASNSRLSSHAENLVSHLVRKRERTETETRKILFVAHSLGGLVTECALAISRQTAEEHLRQIERCTVGIAFLGVPHYGAKIASWGKYATQMLGVLKRANKEILAVMTPGSEMLRKVENDFRNILRVRKDEGSEISVTCFYEELPVIQIGEIVPQHSAEILGYTSNGIHANHMDMTKFPNREDPGYNSVLGELLRWKKKANKMAVVDPQSDPILWKVPRVNPFYTGRRELGERLAKVFSFDPSAPPSNQRVFVITGLGGTGKSEVCAKFAHDHKNEYWRIFWLDGSSVSTMEQRMIDIGHHCGLTEPSSGGVAQWLVNKKQRWLLIIDNADDSDIGYSQYMPYNKIGDIILTTRNPVYLKYQTEDSEILGSLDPQLARELLFKASSIPESQRKEKEKAAMAVIETLGSHTLAIISAGAFVQRRLCSLEEYPALFQEQKKDLLKFHSKANFSKYENVYKTFEISADYLQNSERPGDLDALNLLHIVAFMHNSGISETIFLRAADYVPETQGSEHPLDLSAAHISRLPYYMQQGWSSNPQDHQRWREARAVLESLSLITVHESNDLVEISLHPLVHDWAKERQDHQIQCMAWQSAATILAMSCEGQFGYTSFFVQLQSHVRVCVSHDIRKFTSDISATEAAQTLIQFAYVLYRVGDDRSLDLLIQQLCSRLQDRDDVSLAIRELVKVFIARVARRMGNFAEALHVLTELVEDRAKRVAEDHPDRLDSEHSLACAYQDNGQVVEAVELLEHVVKVREKLAEDHPSRLASQHELAISYMQIGQTKDAVKLLRHVVKVLEKLAEDHPDRLASQHELASAYLANGRIDEAMKLLEYVVKIKEKLAEDHPSRLHSQHELALAYRKNGRIDEAIDLIEHVVKVRQEMLAEDHPDRLTSQHELARAYLKNRQMDEAIVLFRHVVKIRREKLAEDHPDRLMSGYNLAMAYQANKQIDKAIELLEHVVKIEREKLAEDDPSRLLTERALAEAYEKKAQNEDR